MLCKNGESTIVFPFHLYHPIYFMECSKQVIITVPAIFHALLCIKFEPLGDQNIKLECNYLLRKKSIFLQLFPARGLLYTDEKNCTRESVSGECLCNLNTRHKLERQVRALQKGHRQKCFTKKKLISLLHFPAIERGK